MLLWRAHNNRHCGTGSGSTDTVEGWNETVVACGNCCRDETAQVCHAAHRSHRKIPISLLIWCMRSCKRDTIWYTVYFEPMYSVYRTIRYVHRDFKTRLNPNKQQPPFLSLPVKSFMPTSFSKRNPIQIYDGAQIYIGVSSNSEKVIQKCENMPFAKYKRIEMARTRGCQFSSVV